MAGGKTLQSVEYLLLIVSKHEKQKQQQQKTHESRSEVSKIASEIILETMEKFTLAGSGEPVLNYKDISHLRTEHCFMSQS